MAPPFPPGICSRSPDGAAHRVLGEQPEETTRLALDSLARPD